MFIVAKGLFQNLSALLLLLLLLEEMPGRGWAQNGKLYDSSVVTLKGPPEETQLASVRDSVELKTITYLSGGLKVKGYPARPTRGTNLPCVIYNRGGSSEFGVLTDELARAKLGRVASWGYVVVASQYRGNAGGEVKEEFGGQDVDDVLNLIRLLESLPDADVTRIGMWGRSRGGMMTYIALTKTDRIAAAVIEAGLANAFDSVARRPEMETSEGFGYSLVPNYAASKEAALTARSAVRWPEKLNKKTPILVIHGSADWQVHPTQALEMASKLVETRHPFRFVLFEGGDHKLSDHREEADQLIRDWLDRYVRDKKPWPSLELHGR